MNQARRVAEFLTVGIWTLAFLFTAAGICASLLGSSAAGTKDFVIYWAAGQQLIHHANPYDANAVLGLERSAGFPLGDPVLIVRNPPSALLFAVPLGLLGPRAALLLWSMFLIACLVISVRMIWDMHGRPKNHLDFLGYSFGPALVCLLVGQVSLLVLLGLVLFLRLHRSSPFLAGISLWLCLLKPHLFLPFGIALLMWAILTRSYSILVGAAVALGVSSGIALLLDPAAWMHYGEMIRTPWIDRLAIPCLSVMLRRIVSPNTIWLQYLPMALGCVWALGYFRRHREHWDWMEHGSPLLIVSVLVSPYSWPTDQAILMPALLHALYQTRSRSLVGIFALSSALVGVWSLRGDVPLHSAFYLWFPPAWLAWYLYATSGPRTTNAFKIPRALVTH
jgi:Glycosyltransferase family 87